MSEMTDLEFLEEDDELSREDIESQQAIKTKDDLFLYLDSKLTEQERKELVLGAVEDMHFSYGLWIRNLIIYPGIVDYGNLDAEEGQQEVTEEELLEDFSKFMPKIFFADGASSEILKEFQAWLREKKT
ncbi:MAG: hypothetical protein MJY79_01640 [Bacteroidaceae bacterium]|nr:hypothetical protein [Bacteroidaceae bacterium]